MISPRPRRALDARSVVTNPEKYANRWTLRLMAWAQLKADRGQFVSQTHLQRLQKTQTSIEALQAAGV